MEQSLITIKDFEVRGEDHRMLSSAFVNILEGESLAIYGPGGSGKSLLLKFIHGEKVANLDYSLSTFERREGLTFYLDMNGNKDRNPASIPSDQFDLYLIDEPENGYRQEDFQVISQNIKSSNSTLVFVTHHLDYLENFADRILVMRYGEQVGIYTKESFFNNDDPYIDYLSKMGC